MNKLNQTQLKKINGFSDFVKYHYYFQLKKYLFTLEQRIETYLEYVKVTFVCDVG